MEVSNPGRWLCCQLALLGGLTFVYGSDYPKAYLSDGQVWIQASESQPAAQATHDCPNKSKPIVSADGRVAYSVICADRPGGVNLVVLDSSAKELYRSEPIQMPKLRVDCTKVGNLEWLDDHRIGINCDYSAAVQDHLVFDIKLGKVEKEFGGSWFTWSPDRTTIAHIGPIMHDDEPMARNYCLMFNGKFVYTPRCSNEKRPDDDGIFRDIHSFVQPFAWSPDSKRIAFVEKVYDWRFGDKQQRAAGGEFINTRHFLAVVSVTGRVAGFPLKQMESPAVQWVSNTRIKLTSAGVETVYDLLKTKPQPIP